MHNVRHRCLLILWLQLTKCVDLGGIKRKRICRSVRWNPYRFDCFGGFIATLFTSENLTIFACLLKPVCITRERHLRKMFTRTANHPGKWSVDRVCDAGLAFRSAPCQNRVELSIVTYRLPSDLFNCRTLSRGARHVFKHFNCKINTVRWHLFSKFFRNTRHCAVSFIIRVLVSLVCRLGGVIGCSLRCRGR